MINRFTLSFIYNMMNILISVSAVDVSILYISDIEQNIVGN